MPQVRIVTDSTSDLGPRTIRDHGVEVVPYTVNFGSDSYVDGSEITASKLFEMVSERRALPKTSAPSPDVFRRVFESALCDADEVVFVGISSKFSSGTQNARLAAAGIGGDRVVVVDSANLSSGIGLQVVAACELAAAGKTAREIASELARISPRVRTSFIIDTLDYLRMGGRCTGVQALVGTMLQMRPIISVVDGAMVVAEKVRGPRRKALDRLLERFAQDASCVSPDRVFVTHTGCEDDAASLTERIRDIAPAVKEVVQTTAGAVIASHCGPGTIGIIYMVK